MRIVLDAMGSDNMPVVDVAGGVEAARRWPDTEVILVGDQSMIEQELSKQQTAGLKLRVHHAADRVSMTDKPRAVVRGKPDSSMHVGMNLVKTGEADGFVTMGHTGATLAIAMLSTLKRISGIKRPAIGAVFPTPGRPVLLDNGANADCTPEYLLQFAIMGTLYHQCMHGRPNPTVALLSNGEEDGKGNMLVQETDKLLRASGLNFIGSVEPGEFLNAKADVAIADGFVGNVLLKTAESTSRYIVDTLRTEIRSGVLSTIGGLLARPALRRAARNLDPNSIGGAPLLGVNGVVFIGHGKSTSEGVCNAIGQARQGIEFGIVNAIQTGIAQSQ